MLRFCEESHITSGGLDTSAIYGFTSALLDLLSKENPSHIAVCFDLPQPTERHEIFPEYKANRTLRRRPLNWLCRISIKFWRRLKFLP